MPFRDNLVLFKARLAANLPQASLSDQSLFMGLAQAFLSADADTQALITASQSDMFLTTATGLALDRKAADYGARRHAGRPAKVDVTFLMDQAAPTPVIIPLGTLVSTVGDGLVADALFFTTDVEAAIFVGNTYTTVPATCTLLGAMGNVAAHTVIVLNSGLMGGLLSVDNPRAAFDGADPDSDSTLRAQALGSLLSKYSPHALEAAVLSVEGTFDAYALDPQNGLGYVDLYWCDPDGNQPGLLGSGLVYTIAADTLADQVNQALLHVLPPNILVSYQAFDVSDVLPSVTYVAPPAFADIELTPVIQQAVVTYINSLLHGQPVSLYGMVQFVTGVLGNILVDLVPMVSPSFAATIATPTQLYRCNRDPVSVHIERLS